MSITNAIIIWVVFLGWPAFVFFVLYDMVVRN